MDPLVFMLAVGDQAVPYSSMNLGSTVAASIIRVLLRASALAAAALMVSPANAIVGGRPESGDVASNLVHVGICTGIVLASDVVLTAGHCVTGKVAWRAGSGQLQVSQTREALVFGDAQPDAPLPNIDLALLRIETPIGGAIKPASLSSAPLWPGDEVTITGFGEAIEGQANTAGVLRSGDLSVVEPYGWQNFVAWLEGDGHTGACKGDSGGALTHGGLVTGVVTAIVGHCGFRTKAVLIGPQRSWIDQTLGRWGRHANWVV